jgi:hypothetical protein
LTATTTTTILASLTTTQGVVQAGCDGCGLLSLVLYLRVKEGLGALTTTTTTTILMSSTTRQGVCEVESGCDGCS